MKVLLAALALLAPGPQPGQKVKPPEWVRRPTPEEITSYFPPLNANNRRGGRADLECFVSPTGLAEKCTATEKPEGSGFAAAAVLLSSVFRFIPPTIDGKPVEGFIVRVPVTFAAPPAGSKAANVLARPPWAQTPTPEQIAAVFPSSMRDSVDRAHVVIRCEVSGDGGLRRCAVTSQEPTSRSVSEAALKLVPHFRVLTGGDVDPIPPNAYLNLSIVLPNPARPQPAIVIRDPNWVALPAPEDVQAAFPAKATAAGLSTGRAAIECRADHFGALGACTVLAEDPTGLGFGEAALQVASKMKLSPWTTSGSPTDGATIRFPLRLDGMPRTEAEAAK